VLDGPAVAASGAFVLHVADPEGNVLALSAA
jgi:hypothetical protein